MKGANVAPCQNLRTYSPINLSKDTFYSEQKVRRSVNLIQMSSSSSSGGEPKSPPESPASEAGARCRSTLDNFLDEFGQNTVTDVLWGNIGTMNRIYSIEGGLPDDVDINDFVDDLMGDTVRDLVRTCLLDFCGDMNRTLGSPSSEDGGTIDLTPPESERKKRMKRESLSFSDENASDDGHNERKNFMDFDSDKDDKPVSPRSPRSKKRIIVQRTVRNLPAKTRRIVRRVVITKKKKSDAETPEKDAPAKKPKRVVKRKTPPTPDGEKKKPVRKVRKVVKSKPKEEEKIEEIEKKEEKPKPRMGRIVRKVVRTKPPIKPEESEPKKRIVKRVIRKKTSPRLSPRGGDSDSSALVAQFSLSDSDGPSFARIKIEGQESSSSVSRYSDKFASDSFYSSYYSDAPEEERALKRPKNVPKATPPPQKKKVVRKIVKRVAEAVQPARKTKKVAKKATAPKSEPQQPQKKKRVVRKTKKSV